MKIRDRNGWKLELKKGRPIKNLFRIMRKASLKNTIKYRHL